LTLFRPEKFERLTDEPWDAERVRARIREIATHAEAEPGDLYFGAAGTALALDRLRRRGHADVEIDLSPTLEQWRPDEGEDASLFFGEPGVLLVAYRLAPSTDLADRLYAHVRSNASNQANEVMWGAAGTMLAAHAMHAWTGDGRWRDAWAESADELRRRRDDDGLWTQLLPRRESRVIGAAHGAVSNELALLQGDPDEDPSPVAAMLERTAVVEGELANWPTTEGQGLVEPDGDIRVQWCHGAPGIVATTASYLPEELLLAGAELTWRAGPHGKGPGLCHGTAGNGYALLKTFERTGDERWLDRARRFAVHALGQLDREDRGHSLWNGDVGVALYAADCLEARADVPVLDGWD
jgi:hypothetical protein